MADSITSINNLTADSLRQTVNQTTRNTDFSSSDTKQAFSSVLESAMKMINETNTLISNADAAQMNFSMGNSDNAHDLIIAQNKAALSLQYTVAIKNQLVSAYKEIMNMQI